MAEALSVLASVVAIIQITDRVTTLARSMVHTKQDVHSVLVALVGKLCAFKGLFDGLRMQIEMNESDSARLTAWKHIDGPLEASKEALLKVQGRLDYLGRRAIGKFVVGTVLDRETAKAIKELEDVKPILEMALQLDQ